MKDMEQALTLMTNKQRKVIELRLKGLSQQKIADKLGVSQQAISKHIQRGINRSKKTISFVL